MMNIICEWEKKNKLLVCAIYIHRSYTFSADSFDPDDMLEEILRWKMEKNEKSDITHDDKERMKELPNKKLPL